MTDYTKKKWDEISKVKDLLTFLEDPKADVMELMKTLVDPTKSGFWIAANIEFDIDVNKIINDHNGKINFVSLDNGAKIEIIFTK